MQILHFIEGYKEEDYDFTRQAALVCRVNGIYQ